LFLFNIKEKRTFAETGRYLTIIRNPVLRRTGNCTTDILGIKDPRKSLVHGRMSPTVFHALIEKNKLLPPYNLRKKTLPLITIK
jgi:hypothetical protein